MATWAKGIDFKNSANTTRVGGVGIYGTDTASEKLYIGLGSEPWNNNGLQITSSSINFKGNKIYHAGDKPTPADIGASDVNHTHSYLPLSGGTITGETTFNNYLSVNAWSGYGSGKAQIWFNGNTKALTLQPSTTDILIGSNYVYHQGRKPTASDIGAAAASHNHDGVYMKQALANSFYGMTANGDTSNWVRTTVNGIIPYQSGGASSLGTSSWPFTNIYANNIYDNGTLLEDKFSPISHTHNYAGSSSAGGAATTALTCTGNSATATTSSYLGANSRMDYGWNGINYFNISGTAGAVAKTNDTPSTAWWHIMRFNHANSNGYYTDLAVPFNDVSLYYKRVTAGSVQNGGWIKVLDSLNYNSYAPTKTGGGASGTWGISVSGSSASCTGNSATTTKLATARTLTIGNTGKSFDGTANVAWSVSEIGAAPASHNHGLLHDSLALTLANTTTDSGWSMINGSYNGFLLKSIRVQASTPNWIVNNYGAGIAFGGGDTKGVLSTAYNTPLVKIAGGNGTAPVWWIGLSGNSGSTYNLASFMADGGTYGTIKLSNWIRTTGATGWYSETYQGGWYMTDTTWIRAYNSKSVYTPGTIRGDAGFHFNSGNTKITTGSDNTLRLTTPSGYGDIGPRNTSYFHFSTDRPKFYFYQPIEVNSDIQTNAYMYCRAGVLYLGQGSNSSYVSFYDSSGTRKGYVGKGSPDSNIIYISADVEKTIVTIGHFSPSATRTYWLGTNSPDRQWKGVCCEGGTVGASDARAKENIERLDGTIVNCNEMTNEISEYQLANYSRSNARALENDYYEFIKDRFKPTYYNYKLTENINEETKEYILNPEDEYKMLKNVGFIAQDYDLENDKVAQEFIFENPDGTLAYNHMSYVTVGMIALQEATKKIESLENELNELKEYIKNKL